MKITGRHLTTSSGFNGECNQCGLCCTHNGTQCLYLAVGKAIGEPFATKCEMYDTRYEGMPIPIVDSADRRFVKFSVCRKDSARESEIIGRWIGKGCTLKLVAKNG